MGGYVTGGGFAGGGTGYGDTTEQSSDPRRQQRPQQAQAATSPPPAQAPKSPLVDQIMAQRTQALQNLNLVRQGGSEYFDWLDSMRNNPFSGFY